MSFRDAIGAIMSGHPVDKQQPPLFWRPIWYVGHLVYQGGNPILKRSSLTGGGFLPQRDLAGHEQPGWQPYATPISSAVGSGALPSRPNFTTGLSGGQTSNQF